MTIRSVQRAMWRLVEAMSCDCAAFETGEDLLARLATEQSNLIILDIHMPGASGPEVLAEVRSRGIEVPLGTMAARQTGRLKCVESL